MQKLIAFIRKRPIISTIVILIGLSLIAGILYSDDFWGLCIACMIFAAFFICPMVLTLINLISLFVVPKEDVWRKRVKWSEYITIVLGLLYSIICYTMVDLVFHIITDAEWSQQLYNNELHQPMWTDGLPSFIVLCAVGGAGYFVLSCIKLDKLPPLMIVLSIAAMYLGIFECIMWCVQIFRLEYCILCLFPFNCIMIAVKTIRHKIHEWENMEQHCYDTYKDRPVLNYFNHKLMHAAYWPVIAFIFMWPLLGIIFCVLMLFGQKPDAVIKVWTETADWRLSEQTAPPNLYIDEHYLCTVAAGGHSRIVKPIRMGERHGHRVVVNRQLCIANAFEQILEERTPKFHRCVRHIYDTYGFPVARLIKTKSAADIVYLIMKPLEWMFLIVIYLCDVKPENRISVQYLPQYLKSK